MTQSKYILLSTLTVSLVLLAGCSSVQIPTNAIDGTSNDVVINTNATVNNENLNIEQVSEVDTSDWSTYINDVYGFSIQYPENYNVITWSMTDVLFSQSGNIGEFKISIQNYEEAPETDSTLLYSKATLANLKSALETDPAVPLINGQPVKIDTVFNNEEEGSFRRADIFLDNGYVHINLPLSAYNPANSSSEAIESKHREIIQLFDRVIATFKLLDKNIVLNVHNSGEDNRLGTANILGEPYCFRFEDTDYATSLQTILDQFNQVGNLEEFINDPTVQNLRSQGSLMQLCSVGGGDTIGFVMYGDFDDDNNNVVGIYRDAKSVTQAHYNPNAGDISVCNISGFVEDVMIYSCGGGDGGGGWNKIYTLDLITAESQLIKDCEFYLEDNTCTQNLLNVTEHPQARYFWDETDI